jgi:hypothetical protein
MKNKILVLVGCMIAAVIVYAAQPFGGLQNAPITEGGLNFLQDKTATIAGATTFTGNSTFSGTVAIGGGTAVAKTLFASAALNFGSIAANTAADLTITVTGATTNGVVSLGSDGVTLEAGIVLFGWVTAANTVTVRAANVTVGAVDPAIRTVHAMVVER